MAINIPTYKFDYNSFAYNPYVSVGEKIHKEAKPLIVPPSVLYSWYTGDCLGFAQSIPYIRTVLQHYYELGMVQFGSASKSKPVALWNYIKFSSKDKDSHGTHRHNAIAIYPHNSCMINTYGRSHDMALKQILLIMVHFHGKYGFTFNATGLQLSSYRHTGVTKIISPEWIVAQEKVTSLTGLKVDIPIHAQPPE